MQQSLVLKQALAWKMNQSLHQSIEILQLNGVELYEYVKKIAEENPFIEDIRPIDRQVLSQFQDTTDTFESWNASKKTMYEQLKENMYMLVIDDEELAEAVYFGIDSLNENGYLEITIEEWAAYCGLTIEKTEEALRLLQSLEPAGIGARNLQECIRLQLKQMKSDFPFMDHLFEQNLVLIAEEDTEGIAAAYQITEEEAEQLVKNMKLCHPNPGRLLVEKEPEYIIPEATIYKEGGGWKLSFFHWSSPTIEIQTDLLDMDMPQEGKDFLKQKKKELEMLDQAIRYRGRTLERILHVIMEKQVSFFEEGALALQPLTLQEIAEVLHLHISTISRAISQKYIQTDMGILPIKYFLQREARKGEGVARIVIQHYLKEMIAQEDSSRPLSDEKIRMQLEKDYHISIARRTVMKYREELNIPSSIKRKRRSG